MATVKRTVTKTTMRRRRYGKAKGTAKRKGR